MDSDRLEALHSDSTFQQTPRSRHTLQAGWSKHRRWGYGTAKRQQRLALWPPPATRRRGEQLSIVPYALPVMTPAVTASMPGVRKMTAMRKVFAVSTKAKAESQGDRRTQVSTGTIGIRPSVVRCRRIRILIAVLRRWNRLRGKLLAESYGTG